MFVLQVQYSKTGAKLEEILYIYYLAKNQWFKIFY